MKKARIISLIVFVVSAFVSLDLLINLLGSMIPTMNDGIGTHSIIWGNLYLGIDFGAMKDFLMHLL